LVRVWGEGVVALVRWRPPEPQAFLYLHRGYLRAFGRGICPTMADAAVAPAAAAAGAGGNAAQEGQAQQSMFGVAARFFLQMVLFSTVINFFSGRNRQQQVIPVDDLQSDSMLADGGNGVVARPIGAIAPRTGTMRNLFGPVEECDLFVHLAMSKAVALDATNAESLASLLNETRGTELGLLLLWHERVWYEDGAKGVGRNVSVGPFPSEVLSGNVTPYIVAT